MKRNQLTRALRIDKFTAAALELTLHEYLSEEQAMRKIPVLSMITMPAQDVKRRADAFARRLRRLGLPARVEVQPCQSQIGGGSLPLERDRQLRGGHPSGEDLRAGTGGKDAPAGRSHHPPHSQRHDPSDMRTVPEEDAALAARELKEGEVLEP